MQQQQQNLFFISDHALTQKIADKIIHKYLPEDGGKPMVLPPSNVATLSSASTLFWLNQQGQFIVGNTQILAAYLRLIPTILKFCPELDDSTPSQLLDTLQSSPQITSQFPMTLQTQLQFIEHQFQTSNTLRSSLPTLTCKQIIANAAAMPTPPATPPSISTPPLTPIGSPPMRHLPVSMEVNFQPATTSPPNMGVYATSPPTSITPPPELSPATPPISPNLPHVFATHEMPSSSTATMYSTNPQQIQMGSPWAQFDTTPTTLLYPGQWNLPTTMINPGALNTSPPTTAPTTSFF